MSAENANIKRSVNCSSSSLAPNSRACARTAFKICDLIPCRPRRHEPISLLVARHAHRGNVDAAPDTIQARPSPLAPCGARRVHRHTLAPLSQLKDLVLPHCSLNLRLSKKPPCSWLAGGPWPVQPTSCVSRSGDHDNGRGTAHKDVRVCDNLNNSQCWSALKGSDPRRKVDELTVAMALDSAPIRNALPGVILPFSPKNTTLSLSNMPVDSNAEHRQHQSKSRS